MMYYVELLDNKTKKTFTKQFDSYYFFRKFLTKVRYSKKLTILSHSNEVE